MAVADVVHVVAVEIHIAAARHILDPDAVRLRYGVKARRRDGLAQEMPLVGRENLPRGGVERAGLPAGAATGEVGVALGLDDVLARIPPHG